MTYDRDPVNHVWVAGLSLSPGIVRDGGGQANCHFGSAMALSADGSILAVGAPFHDHDGSSTEAGAVYLFEFVDSATGYREITFIRGVDVGFGAGNLFGSTVALSDDANTLVIGAPRYNSGQGGVRVWYRSTGMGACGVLEWRPQTAVLSPTSDTSALLGSSISLDSTAAWLVIGAPMEASTSGQGAVYTYLQSIPGVWSLEAKLESPAGGNGAGKFGTSVAVTISPQSGGVILAVGAPGEGTHGEIYQLEWQPWMTVPEWEYTFKATPWDAEGSGARAGSSMAISPDGTSLLGQCTTTHNEHILFALRLLCSSWLFLVLCAVSGRAARRIRRRGVHRCDHLFHENVGRGSLGTTRQQAGTAGHRCE